MEFQVSFSNVFVTLLYILPGYLLCKAGKAKGEHLATLSSVLVYICSPCMIFSSFLPMRPSGELLRNMGIFFAITLSLQIVFMLGLYFILRRRYENPIWRLLTIGSVFGNVGFFGLPMVIALLPDSPEAACYSSVYVLTMNLLTFTVGVFCLTRDRKFMSFKAAIFNPTVLTFCVSLPFFLLRAGDWLPTLLTDSISLVGSATTPLCMIILGIRLATVRFRDLFTRPAVYLICLGKLLVFPLFCYGAVCLLPLSEVIKASILILSGAPCAAVILNLAEIHHSERELAANCVLLSTLLCLVTLPLLTTIL